ncbi:MAG TPA: thioredoxin family protein [Cytophagaceae bacterium]|jgi:peroxiredoxin|nr:thioredoxin family protein [Cytophagaceae bacterium]
MEKRNILAFLLLLPFLTFGQASSIYKVGDKVENFTLTNVVDGSKVSLSGLSSTKAVVLVFTSHECPYTKIYEQRVKDFVQEYNQKGVLFLLINSNNPVSNPEESPEEMAKAAKERGYKSPYLSDASQIVCKQYGASKTPEIFVLKNQSNGFVVKYKGAIDDNPQNATDVTAHYLKDALDAILNNQPVKITEKRASGCMIHQ